MKILITGGNGYIGSSLHSYLSDRYEVTSVTRNDFDLRNQRDVTKWFKDKSFDAVIHTAIRGGSRLHKDHMSIVLENIMMYQNLFINKHRYSKFINLGSGAELYARNTPYGFSKHLIRESVLSNNNFYNIRIFGLFDKNELDTRFIKSNIIRYINREKMVIHKNKLMDFFHMKDFVSLIDYYVSNDSPQKEVNCSYEKKYSLLDITAIINNLSDYDVSIETQEEGMDDSYVGEFNLPIGSSKIEDRIYDMYLNLVRR